MKITPTPDYYSHQNLKNFEQSGRAPIVPQEPEETSDAPYTNPNRDKESQHKIHEFAERRQGDRRVGDRRKQQIPVLLDTRANRDRRTGERRSNYEAEQPRTWGIDIKV